MVRWTVQSWAPDTTGGRKTVSLKGIKSCTSYERCHFTERIGVHPLSLIFEQLLCAGRIRVSFEINIVIYCVDHKIFLCRILLAALDHNVRAFKELVEGRYNRDYSKHSKNWHVVPVKEEKSYKYWDILLSKILKARADDNCIVRRVEVSPTNPQNLAPTIGMREPPATKDLVEAKLSRFKSKE